MAVKVWLCSSLNQPLKALSFSSARKAFHCIDCPPFDQGAAVSAPLVPARNRNTSSPSPASCVARYSVSPCSPAHSVRPELVPTGTAPASSVPSIFHVIWVPPVTLKCQSWPPLLSQVLAPSLNTTSSCVALLGTLSEQRHRPSEPLVMAASGDTTLAHALKPTCAFTPVALARLRPDAL